MKKAVGSIRDVAREAGLSIATVSRVMNGGAHVSPKTRDRVLEAAARIDYLPNPAARALSTRQSKTIAAIIPSIEHSVFAKYVSAIESTLGAQGYSLVLAISNADQNEELHAARKLLGMGAQAFILSGLDHSPDLLSMFERREVPVVATSTWDPSHRLPTIGYDNAALATEAVQYIAAQGHRNIGMIHGPLADNDRTIARRRGAEAAETGELTITCFETSLDIRGGKEAIARVLADGRGCTAVLCASDVLALGVYFGLAEAGKSVPDDMSVMGFDNLDWATETVPPLTTIDLPAAGMGRDVAQQIVRHLERGDPLTTQRLPAQIVPRASVQRLRP